MEKILLWESGAPGYIEGEHIPYMTYYAPEIEMDSHTAVVIFPGGGYSHRAVHEGEGYARFLTAHGIAAFVVEYRVSPYRFPYPLLDARRAVRYVRANKERYKVDKVLVMGSSAGGHLAALCATYSQPIDGEGIDEIDRESFIPDGQILCYPVTDVDSHSGSYVNLLGDGYAERAECVNPTALILADTPMAFIWHTANDDCVNILGTYRFVTRLRECSVPHELHVFPDGRHGIGLAVGEGLENPHVAAWPGMLTRWLYFNKFI